MQINKKLSKNNKFILTNRKYYDIMFLLGKKCRKVRHKKQAVLFVILKGVLICIKILCSTT